MPEIIAEPTHIDSAATKHHHQSWCTYQADGHQPEDGCLSQDFDFIPPASDGTPRGSARAMTVDRADVAITIEARGTAIDLGLDEARALLVALADLLGSLER